MEEVDKDLVKHESYDSNRLADLLLLKWFLQKGVLEVLFLNSDVFKISFHINDF